MISLHKTLSSVPCDSCNDVAVRSIYLSASKKRSINEPDASDDVSDVIDEMDKYDIKLPPMTEELKKQQELQKVRPGYYGSWAKWRNKTNRKLEIVCYLQSFSSGHLSDLMITIRNE